MGIKVKTIQVIEISSKFCPDITNKIQIRLNRFDLVFDQPKQFF